MSERTQSSTSLHVRKTRPTAPPRKDSGKAPRAPRKTKAIVSKPEPGPPTTAAQPVPNTNNRQSIPSSGGIPSTVTATPKDDLDQITHRMKKIKINVLTKEQKAARLKAKEEAAARDAVIIKAESLLTEQPPFSPSVTEGVPTPKDLENEAVNDTATMIEAGAPPEPEIHASIPTTPTIISPTEPSPSSTPFASSPLVQPPSEPTGDGDLFIPYQPDGPPAHTIPIQRLVHILEPNTGTPAKPNVVQPSRLQSFSVPASPARRGGHAFTATSTIPFSPEPIRSISKDNVPLLPRPVVKTEDVDRDARENEREIPEAPERS
jgi:histone deacetylase HOS3